MTNQEIDRRCAELMGWTEAEGAGYHDFMPWWKGSPDRRRVDGWSPTANPADDYAVLEWVRENMTEQQQDAFVLAVGNLAAENASAPILAAWSPLHYRVGDYARALVAVKGGV